MEIKGYKAFNKDMTNRYGLPFEEGKVYISDKDPVFGNNGSGFHFCVRLEDTLRYFPAMEEEIKIASITALGNMVEGEDDYAGYYEMYSTNALRIDRILSRDDILHMFLSMEPNERVIRFIQGFRLTKEEIVLFRKHFIEDQEKSITIYGLHGPKSIVHEHPSIIDKINQTIMFYQEDIKDAYEEKPKQKLKTNNK